MSRYPLTNGNYAEPVIQLDANGNPVTPGQITIDSSTLATGAKQDTQTTKLTNLDTNLGAKADAAAANSSASSSLISILKGFWSTFTTTANGLKVDGSAVIQPVLVNTGTNFIGRTGTNAFRVQDNFTRPSDTNAYAVGDCLSNSTSAPAIRSLDLSGSGATNGQQFMIVNCRIICSSVPSTLMTAKVWLFNSSFTPSNDNAAFDISNSVSQTGGIVVECSNTHSTASNSRCVSDPSTHLGKLGASSTILYYAIQVTTAHTPISGARYDVVIEGHLL